MSRRINLLGASGPLHDLSRCKTLLNDWANELSNSFDLFSAKRIDSALGGIYIDWFDEENKFSKDTVSFEHINDSDRGVFGLFEGPLGNHGLGSRILTGWGIIKNPHCSWVMIEIKYDNVEYDLGSRRKRVWKSAIVKPANVTEFFKKNLIKGNMYEFLRGEIGSVIKSWHDRSQKRMNRSAQLLTDFNTETFLIKELK